MSRFNVDTDSLISASQQCIGISTDIGTLTRQIIQIKNKLDNEMGRYDGVISALDTCITNSSKCMSRVSWYGYSGDSIAKKYKETDDRIYRNILTEPLDQAKLVWENIFGLLGEIGPLGYFSRLLYDGLVEHKPENWIPDAIKLVGTLAKPIGEGGGTFAEWANAVLSIEEFKKMEYMPVKVFENDYLKMSTLGKKINTFCNWAAAVVNSALSNAEEYSDSAQPLWLNGDFLTETVTETLLNVGEYCLIKSAVGLTLGAGLAAAGAPAIATTLAVGAAVAGLTVLVDWGADNFVKLVTDNPDAEWKECVSDLVLNDIHDTFDEIKYVTNTISSIGNAIGNAVGDVTNSFGSACNWGSLSLT